CFLVNGLSFVAVLWTLAAVKLPLRERSPAKLSFRQSIFEGLQYVRNDRTVLVLVLIALVPTFLAQPYITLLTLFAYSVYDIGPDGLGLLISSAAAGSIGGALLVASAPNWATSR